MSSIELSKAASICRFAAPLASVAARKHHNLASQAVSLRQWPKLVCKLLSLGMTPGIDTLDIGSTTATFNSME